MRLLRLHDGVVDVLSQHEPDEVAVEQTFSNVNPDSTIKLGHARGVIMVPPAKAGLPIAEYAAREIKKAVVGTGAADKTQIAFMIRRLLPGANLRSGDAADALAIAITHAHRRRSLVSRR
jgi:crossover junction endodeoxyribonuclease RuvC